MRTKLLFGAAAFLIFSVANAQAGMITLTGADIIQPPGESQTSPNPSEQDILDSLHNSIHQEYIDVTDLGDLLYKSNVGTGEENVPLKDSYSITDFSGTGGTLKYSGSGDIFDPTLPIWLVIKDGNAGFVIYDLDSTGPNGVGWDGLMDIVFTNAGLIVTGETKLKDISNVQIWGSSTEGPDPGPGLAPEPSSWALMAIGMLGLGGYSWRKRRMLAA